MSPGFARHFDISLVLGALTSQGLEVRSMTSQEARQEAADNMTPCPWT